MTPVRETGGSGEATPLQGRLKQRPSRGGSSLILLVIAAALSLAIVAPTAATSQRPKINGVLPTSGSAAGGTTVTITGKNLAGATAVMFGSTPATSFTVNSAASITAVSPTQGPAREFVTVTTPLGTSRGKRFSVAPEVTGVSPEVGPTAGGTHVIVSGAGFVDGSTTFKFGKTAATILGCSSTTTCEVLTPPHKLETVAVTVRVGRVKMMGLGATFTYDQPPIVTSVVPNEGPEAGGTSVVITGENFNGTTAVKFGKVDATSFTLESATSITAVSPARSAGTFDVTVQNATKSLSAPSPADQFTYRKRPAVSEVNPILGPEAGGTSVEISGKSFTGATAVKFGSNNAASFTVNSDSLITATSAPGTGNVDVTVTTAGGTSETRLQDQFGYVP